MNGAIQIENGDYASLPKEVKQAALAQAIKQLQAGDSSLQRLNVLLGKPFGIPYKELAGKVHGSPDTTPEELAALNIALASRHKVNIHNMARIMPEGVDRPDPSEKITSTVYLNPDGTINTTPKIVESPYLSVTKERENHVPLDETLLATAKHIAEKIYGVQTGSTPSEFAESVRNDPATLHTSSHTRGFTR
jgi:hypothetical protein